MTQKERELWSAFLRSGKVEDYVKYFEEKSKGENKSDFSS